MIRYFLLSLLIISSNCTYSTKNQNGIIQEYYNRVFVISDNDVFLANNDSGYILPISELS